MSPAGGTGRVALVTGGGRGIGRAIAERLANDGARVVVAGRYGAALDAVARATGGVAFPLDLADRASIEPALQRLVADVGAIEILVNNAGVAESAPFDRTTDAIWDAAFAINVTAPFVIARALAPAMKRAGRGRIVMVASNAGLTGYAYTTAYVASKHALVGLTRALAVELARSGVTVNAVCPGFVDTDMSKASAQRIASATGQTIDAARAALEAMMPAKRLVRVEEVAHVVAMLCSEEAAAVNGQAIPIDFGQVME